MIITVAGDPYPRIYEALLALRYVLNIPARLTDCFPDEEIAYWTLCGFDSLLRYWFSLQPPDCSYTECVRFSLQFARQQMQRAAGLEPGYRQLVEQAVNASQTIQRLTSNQLTRVDINPYLVSAQWTRYCENRRNEARVLLDDPVCAREWKRCLNRMYYDPAEVEAKNQYIIQGKLFHMSPARLLETLAEPQTYQDLDCDAQRALADPLIHAYVFALDQSYDALRSKLRDRINDLGERERVWGEIHQRQQVFQGNNIAFDLLRVIRLPLSVRRDRMEALLDAMDDAFKREVFFVRYNADEMSAEDRECLQKVCDECVAAGQKGAAKWLQEIVGAGAADVELWGFPDFRIAWLICSIWFHCEYQIQRRA